MYFLKTKYKNIRNTKWGLKTELNIILDWYSFLHALMLELLQLFFPFACPRVTKSYRDKSPYTYCYHPTIAQITTTA